MIISPLSFSIPVGWSDLDQKVRFAVAHRTGLELSLFASGAAVSDLRLRQRMEAETRERVRDFPNALSYHAAFIDLTLHSEDPAVAAIARERIRRDLESASRLGCEKAVFHTGFNPLVPVPRYERRFLQEHRAFWPKMAEAFPDVTICLENMWEPDLSLLHRLLRAIAHPRVRLCLDVAHAFAYSDQKPQQWIRELGPSIAHMHWNDNFGDCDSHLCVGAGGIGWKSILHAAARLVPAPTVVLELESLPTIRKSLRFLNRLGNGSQASSR